MSKMKKIVLAVSVLAIVSFSGYYYVTHAGVRDLTSEETDFAVTSEKITTEFTSNTDSSNKKYLEKAVAISGKITDVSGLAVIVDNTIVCNLKKPDPTIKKNTTVTVKGRVVGFDDLMGELKLDQCFIVKS